MSARPTNIALVSPERLRITWDDGQVRECTVRDLRDKCPCATCREKRNAPPPPSTGLTILSMAETQPLRIVDMQPIGNYAYGIAFSDGHDTGIFTLEFLRELGTEVQ